MPTVDGLEATRLICVDPTLADTRVLVLTTFDLDEYVYAALRAGASGFLVKDAGPGELLQAIRIVAAGDALLAPSITGRLIAEFAARQDPRTPPTQLADLTERERQVLRLVAAGLSNAEIARRLVISPLTAKTHVARILAKLGCHDRAVGCGNSLIPANASFLPLGQSFRTPRVPTCPLSNEALRIA